MSIPLHQHTNPAGASSAAAVTMAPSQQPGPWPAAELDVGDELTPAEGERLAGLLLAELPAYYDDVDTSFPLALLRAAAQDRDDVGYFTKRKTIYVARLRGEAVAFTVAAFKRGGAVKIGPTAVVPELRRQGIGRLLRERVHRELLGAGGSRKIYLTVSTTNTRSLLFNLQFGFRLEGMLSEQYRAGVQEAVLGLFPLDVAGTAPPPRLPLPARAAAVAGSAEVWPEPDPGRMARFAISRMRDHFGEIDTEFFHSIARACRAERQTYAGKGKRVIALRSCGDDLLGFCVYVPKRGGAVKLSPFLADFREDVEELLDAAICLARREGRRKVYVHVPAPRSGVAALLTARGFRMEAQLREAYTAGVDMLVLGRTL